MYISIICNNNTFYFRHNRFINRRQKTQGKNYKKNKTTNNKNLAENRNEVKEIPPHNNTNSQSTELLPQQKKNVNNISVQADIYSKETDYSRTLVCNRYIYPNYCEAETQTNIFEKVKSKFVTSQKQHCSKACGPCKKYVDIGVGSDLTIENDSSFKGFSSIKKDEQLLNLTGVNLKTFKFLLSKKIPTVVSKNCKLFKKDRLFILKIHKIENGSYFFSNWIFVFNTYMAGQFLLKTWYFGLIT